MTRLLEADEALAEIERHRNEEKSKQSSQELNKRITKFLSSILSDAAAEPSEKSGGGDAPGRRGGGGGGKQLGRKLQLRTLRSYWIFISDKPLLIPEGTTKLARFRERRSTPAVLIHGDIPRLCALK